MRVSVVGAGVIGLSVAVRLLEAGHRVDVVARDLPQETTSVVAAAIWYPYRAEPAERVEAWAAHTFADLAELATDASTGVRMLSGTEWHRTGQPSPAWADTVTDFQRVEQDVSMGYAQGWSFTTPVVSMPRYLGYLVSRVESLGGTLTRLSLSALPTGADVVINCSGIGSRLLAADQSVTPIRGQVVVLDQLPGEPLREWTIDASGVTYVVPREDEIIVGGTAIEGEWSRTPDRQEAKAILDRANALVPALREATVRRHQVGLRPARPAVRLERDEQQDSVIHCYGHGGSGVTVSWGCADEVAQLVDV